MRPGGLAAVEAAKADGRWDAAYDSPSTMEMPEDFQSRLDECPAARTFFDGLNKTNRYSMLYSIQDAKRPETRQRRIDTFVAMLENGETPY